MRVLRWHLVPSPSAKTGKKDFSKICTFGRCYKSFLPVIEVSLIRIIDKITNICLSEGLEFPDIPECLQDLRYVEERRININLLSLTNFNSTRRLFILNSLVTSKIFSVGCKPLAGYFLRCSHICSSY